MKKPFVLPLILCLLCGSMALAENTIDANSPSQSTTVTFEVPEPETNYTVTIPASIAFDEGSKATSMTVTIGADSTLAQGATLMVALEASNNAFQLKQGENAIAYTIKKDDSTLSAGSEVLHWAQGEPLPSAATLYLEVTGSIDGLPAGAYTDTLTFKATVSTDEFDASHDGFEDGGSVIW